MIQSCRKLTIIKERKIYNDIENNLYQLYALSTHKLLQFEILLQQYDLIFLSTRLYCNSH